MTAKHDAERTAKLLAASKQQRLEAARSAAVDFAGVMAAQRATGNDPTAAPSAYKEHAGNVSDAVASELETAREAEAARATEAAAELSLLKAKAAAATTAIGIKRGFVKDLADGHDVLAAEAADSEDAVSAAVELCAALTAEQSSIGEELAALKETLVRERAASAQAKQAIERLRAEEKALTLAHEHAAAAVEALLVEERARAVALAEKRTPAALPVDAVVFVSMPKGEVEGGGAVGDDVPLPSFFAGAVEEVSARLAALGEMREAVLREHEADAKQLAAVATQATAKEALAAAETAAQARARAALQKYEAALS